MDSVTASPSRPAASPVGSRPLIEGPRWYRARIRNWAPILGILVPGAVGAIAYGALRLFETAWSGAVGLIGGMLAAPGLLFVGAPFANRDLYPIAVGASGLAWMLIGLIAGRRATRNPMATWGDFWRHYAWMLFGVWAGVAVALVVVAFSVGDTLL